MPTAPESLRRQFPGMDAEAWEVLGKNFYEVGGHIMRHDKSIKPTERQLAALDYLWLEWDYGSEDMR